MDTKVISTGIRYSSLPESYIRPESERPKLSDVEDCEDVPIIDLGCSDRSLIVQQIADACRIYGFFQVINHAVSMTAVAKMLQVAHEFFQLPLEEKMKLYSDDPSKTMRLSTSFNVKKEKVHNWRDYLRLHCYPLDQYVPEWPSNPTSFKEIVSKYCKEVRELGFRLEELIAESPGLDKNHFRMLGEQGQHMAINYYPGCPAPELTYGLPGHTDPNAIPILLHDRQVEGLQVLKDGKWLAIKPHPDAFVINVGDQLQELKEKYKKRAEDELPCKWFIVNTLCDRVAHSYHSITSPKETLDVLEFEHNSEKQDTDAGDKSRGTSSCNKRNEPESSQNSSNKKKKSCKIYGKSGHLKHDCRIWKKQKKAKNNSANVIEAKNIIVKVQIYKSVNQ